MLEKIEVVIAHRSTRCIAAARAAIDARCLRQTAAPGTAAHAPAPDRTGCASPRGAGIGSGYAPKARTGPAVAVYRTRRIRRTRETRELPSRRARRRPGVAKPAGIPGRGAIGRASRRARVCQYGENY